MQEISDPKIANCEAKFAKAITAHRRTQIMPHLPLYDFKSYSSGQLTPIRPNNRCLQAQPPFEVRKPIRWKREQVVYSWPIAVVAMIHSIVGN